VGQSDPDTPIADYIAAQMPPDVDLTGVVVLAVPIWRFFKKGKGRHQPSVALPTN